jgi:hypothetical protein
VEGIKAHLVEVPDFEHSVSIVERVLKEAVSSWKCIVLAAQNGAIGQHQGLEQLKVVLPNSVTYINRATRNSARCSVESSTWVSRLEHVPIWMYEVAHPQAVVGTVHHVTTLEPKCAIGISRWIGAPEIIPCLIN